MQTRSRPPLPTLSDVLARVHLRLIIFSVLVAGLVLVFSAFMIIRGYAERNLALVARTVSYTIEPAVVFGDVDAVAEGLTQIASMNDVRTIEVVLPDGTLISRWDKPHGSTITELGWASSRVFWPGPTSDAIQHGGETIAVVRVHGGSEGFLRFLRSCAFVAISCLGLTLLATRILSRRLKHDILAPLAHVTDVAHEVRTNRTFGQRVPASGIFEIDRFGQDFNALLEELEGWHASVTQENKELSRQATHDDLTGLGNRALFERMLEATIQEASQKHTSFAVIYIDANKFKQINDSFGHEAGDLVLKHISSRLLASIRTKDRAFRLGGDEFVALLPPSVSRQDAERIKSRITDSMHDHVELPDGHQIRTSVSIGYALYPEDGVNSSELVRAADAAMYANKNDTRETR